MEMKMKLKVEMTMVKPVKKAPRQLLWLSDLDPLLPSTQSPVVYFDRPNGASSSSNFFDSAVLKEALSNVLVPFYPLAGRFRPDDFSRLKINCNDDGVLLVEAESSSVIDDFGDFVAAPELRKAHSHSS